MARHGIRILFRAASVAACVTLAAAAVALEPGAGDPLAWGQENLDAGRYKEAVEFFRKAADNAGSPAGARAALRLAGALRLVGEYDEALKLCESLTTRDPRDKAAACLKAELQHELGRYDEAFKGLDALVEADPQFHRAWAIRKRVAATLGRKDVIKKTADHFFEFFNQNAEQFHKGEADDPMVLACVGLGIQDENPKDAFETGFMLAEHIITKRGLREPEAFVWSGQLAQEKYSFDFAAKRYQTALQLRPRLPDALTGLAQVLIAMPSGPGDFRRAEEMVKQALEVNPRHIEAHLTLAALNVQDDQVEEAKRHIDAALAVNPNHLDALAMLAFYHHDLKQLDKEAEVEKRVLAINPKFADYYCMVGELLESKRGFNDAPEYYRKAIALDPDYWRGYYGLGMNTSRQGAHGEEEGKKLLLKAFGMNKFNLWASNMIKALDKIIGDKEQEVPPEYAQSKTKEFTLKFHSKEAEIIRPYLEEWAEAAHARQSKLFQFQPKGPLSIEVCFSSRDQAARTVGVPNLGALGVCFGRLCTLLSPREGKGHPFNWRRVLEHEFGHVMALQLSEFRVPRWYTEGMSTYLEDDSRLETDQMMVDAIAKGGIKPLEKMNEYFKGNMLMAYVHGRYIVEYIAKTFGWEAHLKALKLFAEGKKVEEVLPAVTGKSLADLNVGQIAYLRDFYRRVPILPNLDAADLAKLEAEAAAPEANAETLARLARAQLRARGGAARAEASADKALERDPKCADALTVLGLVAFNRKDFNGAKSFFEKSVQIAPDAGFSAWQHLGVLYKKEGRTSKAIAALEKARQTFPRYSGENNPHYLLPELYLDQEPPQNEKALAVWKDAVSANTTDSQAAKEGMKLAMKLKDWAAAGEFALACFEIDPYDVEMHRRAGQVFAEVKDFARAAREYHVATALDEKDVDSWVGLARMAKARGDREAAVKAVRAALEIDATHEGARALRKELGM